MLNYGEECGGYEKVERPNGHSCERHGLRPNRGGINFGDEEPEDGTKADIKRGQVKKNIRHHQPFLGMGIAQDKSEMQQHHAHPARLIRSSSRRPVLSTRNMEMM